MMHAATKETIVRVRGEVGDVSVVLNTAHRAGWPFQATIETLAAPDGVATQRVTITSDDAQIAREVTALLAQMFGPLKVEGIIARV